MWSFRKITSIEEPIFNNTLEKFYKLGIEGLVRENIQNSLDGKLSDSKMPVEVIIKTGVVKDSDIPGIEEVREHIASLKGENAYTIETIDLMKKEMSKHEVPYISFEDCNTKGLVGAEHGENVQKGDTWGVYAYKRGVHFIEEDNETENMRGGSHGVGKIACNAASDIYMMFFANCDETGKQHIGGTIQLIEHTLNDTNYRASGCFTREKDEVYYPYENNFGSIFEKKTRGLKIIIPYLRKQYRGEEKVIRAVCDNFFVAILEKKLVVQINGKYINEESIFNIVNDVTYYPEQNPTEIKQNFTPLYIDSYINNEPFNVEIEDLKRKYNFKMFLQYSENIKKARVAIVRGIGMKIEDKKVKRFVNSPFNAVLIPTNPEEDYFLKSLENESHTNLTCDHIKDPQIQKNAKRFLNNIDKEIGTIFNNILKAENPSDGKIDTSEVIYSTERSFRKDLSKETSTVQLTKGNKAGGKNLVKLKTNSKKNKKNKEEKEKKKKIREIIRRVRKKDGEDTEKERVRYPMHPEDVKRIVLNNRECLLFNFNNITQYKNEKICDISMGVIDGTGKTYETEFDITKNYSEIVDKGNDKKCQVDKNIIKDVSITDGQVNLEMRTTGEFNDSLKFIYYVEV